MNVLINIDVPDLAAGIAFYSDGLGLSFRRYLFDRRVAELNLESARVFLIAQPDGSIAVAGSTMVRRYRDHWTPVHLDVVVDHLEDGVERAAQAGARVQGGLVRQAWGRLQKMRDPFGHGFCLITFNEEDYPAEEPG